MIKISEHRRNRPPPPAAVVSDANASPKAHRNLPTIATVIAPKGGVGKTLFIRSAIDRHRAEGQPTRIVQIDRTPQLPDLYGAGVSVVSLPGADAQRADPLAAMMAMEPYSEAIDATITDAISLFVDVGGGPSAAAAVEYIGKAQLDRHIRGHARSVVFLVLVVDPSTMAQTIELGRALEIAHPNAEIVCVLNERDGRFRFFPGSAADRVWTACVRPFLDRYPQIVMPAIAAGALSPFEALNLTFTDLIAAEAIDLGRQLGVSRAIAATLQGDVAEWLSVMWSALEPILPVRSGGNADG